jgi:hypothetical protein
VAAAQPGRDKRRNQHPRWLQSLGYDETQKNYAADNPDNGCDDKKPTKSPSALNHPRGFGPAALCWADISSAAVIPGSRN